MNLLAMSPSWVLWTLIALLGAAAIQDAVQLKISNLITGLVLMLSIVAMFAVGPQVVLWKNLVVFLAILAIGTALFSNGILGGGDVKLFAAVALWTDFLGSFRLLFAICLAGGLLAIVVIILRIFVPENVGHRVKTLRKNGGIPYGIAIAVGTFAVIAAANAGAPSGTYSSDLPALRSP